MGQFRALPGAQERREVRFIVPSFFSFCVLVFHCCQVSGQEALANLDSDIRTGLP